MKIRAYSNFTGNTYIFDYENNFNHISDKMVDDVPELNEETLKVLEIFPTYEITIFLPYNDGEDFYFQFSNNTTHEFLGKDYVGFMVSNFTDTNRETKALEVMQFVYETGQERMITFDVLDDNNNRIAAYKFKIMKNAESLFIFAKDITKEANLKDSQERLFNDMNPKIIVQNGNIVKVNEAFLKGFGFELENVLDKHFLDIITVYKGCEDCEYKSLAKKLIFHESPYFDKLVYCGLNDKKYWIKAHLVYTNYKGAPGILLYLTDVTLQEERQQTYKKKSEEALRIQESLNSIQRLSETAISYKMKDGKTGWSPEIENILDVPIENRVGDLDDLIHRYAVDDEKAYEDEVNKLSPDNPYVEYIQKIKTPKDNIKYIKTYLNYKYDDKGEVVSCLSLNQDVTEEISRQDKLQNLLDDREYLLREVHDKVKNNIQVILSLFDLEERFKSDNLKEMMEDIKIRIAIMAVVHEDIHSSDSLTAIDFEEFVITIMDYTLKYFKRNNINYITDIGDFQIHVDSALSLALIFTELTSNLVHNGIPEAEDGLITIKASRDGDNVELTFEDNGIGLPEGFSFSNLSSLGLLVVSMLMNELEGNISLIDCDGTGFKLKFKKIILFFYLFLFLFYLFF